MSFADLESGQPLANSRPRHMSTLASGVFQITTSVASFERLVNSLGTPKDTPVLRNKLHKMRVHIGQLVKDTSAKLQQASETNHSTEVTASKKIADAKLAKDFQTILNEFQKAQKLAAERENAYAPFIPQSALSLSYVENEANTISDNASEQRVQLRQSTWQEVVLLDNEIAYNEAIIEEREQGILEIQQQISQVNEIFEDLAVLVHDQGVMIDDIETNIDNSAAATAEANTQLSKASKTQKSGSTLTCLLLLIFGVVLFIVIIVLIA